MLACVARRLCGHARSGATDYSDRRGARPTARGARRLRRAIEHGCARSMRRAASARPRKRPPLLNDLGGAYLANDEPLLGLAAFADSARVAPAGTAIAATATLNALRALHESGGPPKSLLRLGGARGAVDALAPTPRKAELLLALGELGVKLARRSARRAQRPTWSSRASARARAERRPTSGSWPPPTASSALEHAAAGDSRGCARTHAPRGADRAARGSARPTVPLRVAARPLAPRCAAEPTTRLLAYSAAVATLDSHGRRGRDDAPRVSAATSCRCTRNTRTSCSRDTRQVRRASDRDAACRAAPSRSAAPRGGPQLLREPMLGARCRRRGVRRPSARSSSTRCCSRIGSSCSSARRRTLGKSPSTSALPS